MSNIIYVGVQNSLGKYPQKHSVRKELDVYNYIGLVHYVLKWHNFTATECLQKKYKMKTGWGKVREHWMPSDSLERTTPKTLKQIFK